jgi:outer membrane protein assembly factor BamB
VAGGLVWSLGQNGTLYGLSASTGAVVEQTGVGVPANHFPTPSLGDGLLLAAGASDVVAFSAATNDATTGTTTSSAPATSTTMRAAAAKPRAPAGGLPAAALAAIALGALTVVGGALWLWRRRRPGVPR